MADPNVNPNIDDSFEFEINLSGVVAATGDRAPDAQEGFYRVTIDSMYINKEKNEKRCVIRAKVAEGSSAGATIFDGINKPDPSKGDADPVRYYWRALAESVGYTTAQLDSGAVRLGPPAFQGRTGYVYYIPGTKNEDGSIKTYSKTRWLVEEEWLRQKNAWEAVKAAKEGSDSVGNPVLPEKPNGSGDSQTKAQILAQLGLQ